MDGLRAVLERSRRLGFLGPGSLRVQQEHAEGFAEAVEKVPHRLLDLGSGGGVPGLVLAAVWPETEVVLLDAAERRCAFLEEAVATLGWNPRVRVHRARAEDAGRDPDLRAKFDLVTARGFGPPPATAECAAPFLHQDGHLVVSEPPDAEPTARWPTEGLALVGLTPDAERRTPYHYRRFRQATLCPDAYPRRTGQPTKRPLF
ncbi:MAG TPA: RsmG family class I SAM-dependent methyltransferase [Acidimicrobiales bacterium]|nr:RsmG family class I SAM-dependent methyltransferase [Acidimicrobiales bacterium]